MAFLDAHPIFTLHGGLPGGEIWSCGLRAHGAQAMTSAKLAAMAQTVATNFKVFQTATTIAAYCWGQAVTFPGVTGRYLTVGGTTIFQTEQAPVGGAVNTGGGPQLPNQCALVVTLLTNTGGRSGKGRIYLPLLNSQIMGGSGADGRTTYADAIAAAFGAFLNRVHEDWAAAGYNERIVVASQGGNNGSPAFSPVTAVKVGNLIDTQRRRRESWAETYSTVAIAA